MSNVIFDSWNHCLGPRAWHQCSFEDWKKCREIMDEWEKSLRNMRYCDWVIHRKLGEAAGLAHRYIIPARGSGKSMFCDSFDDSKKIFRKHREDHEPQEFVTVKDGDVEKWLCEQMRMEQVERVLDISRENADGSQMRMLTSHNPYWSLDPCWMIDKDGNYTLRDVSIVPNYLWDKEI